MNAGLIDKIKEIEGITGVAVVSSDGTIIESSDMSEFDASFIVFAGSTAKEVSDMFVLGPPHVTIIQGSDYRLVISMKDDGYIGVLVKPDANIQSVRSGMASLL